MCAGVPTARIVGAVDSARCFGTQLLLLASECWIVAFSIDRVLSLRNPFMSFSFWTKVYSAAIWGLSSVLGLVLYFDDNSYGTRCL